MPDLTSNATTFRTKRHKYVAYLSILPRTVIFAASVSATPTFPAKTVTVDTVTTGSISDALAGMTIEWYDTNGDLRGYSRVATGGGSGSTLQIAEVSQGTLPIADNWTLKVLDEYLIHDLLVGNTAALPKDSRTAYSDQGSNPNPVCNSGGPMAGLVSGGSLSVDFFGSGSFVIDPDSGGTMTHSWDFDDGTPSSSTDADPAGVTFPAGFRYVSHTATDSGNSKSSTQRIPVWAYDDSSTPPVGLTALDFSYTDEGWTCRFQMPDVDEADIANFPNGTLVCIWERNWYGGTEASYGSAITGRSHIKFLGYLDTTEISIDAETDEVVYTAISPLAALAQTPALPQLTVQDAAPANWQELKSNSVFRTLWYLWQWHTTAFPLHDFIFPEAITDLSFTRLATTVISNQLEQFRDIAGSMGLVPTCDRLGRLILDGNLQYEDETARGNRTKSYDFTTADIVRIEWEDRYWWDVKTVVGEGITDGSTLSANKSVYSHAPGQAPASRGTGTDTWDRLIVADQDELNQRTVLRFAEINGLYYGRMVPKGLRLTLRGGYDFIDPALPEFVTITLPASSNRRGVSFTSDTRWIVRGADIVYSAPNGSREVTYTLDHETYSDYENFSNPDEITDIRPTPEESGLPDFNIPDLIFPDWELPVIVDTPGGDGVLLAVLSGGSGVALTTNFNTPEGAGGPTWTVTTAATLGIDGSVDSAAVDPYSPQYLGTGTTIIIWIATTTEIGKLTWDRSDDSLSYSSSHTFAVANAAGPEGVRQIELTRGVQNLIVVSTNYQDTATRNGIWTIVSTDGGATWGTELQLTSNYNTAFGLFPGLYVGRTGDIFTSAFSSATDFTPAFTGRKSTDSGASFATVTNPNIAGVGLAGCLHFPWHDNASETICYYGSLQFINNSNIIDILYRANGTTRTDITPTDSSSRPYTARGQGAIHSADNNRLRLALAGRSADTNTIAYKAQFISPDGGDSWVQIGTETSDSSVGYLGTHVAENGTVYFWGIDGYIAVGQWNDLISGGVLDVRTGNLNASDDIVNIIGG